MNDRRHLPAAGIGLVLAAGALLAALAVDDVADDARRRELRRAAALEAGRVTNAIERAVVEMEHLADGGLGAASFRRAALPRIGAVPALSAVALAQLDGDALLVRTVVPNDVGILRSGNDLRAGRELDVVVTRAVTEADAAAGTPFRLGDRQMIAVAAPIVADVTAADEAARRAGVRGAVIGALDVAALLRGGWAGPELLVAPDGRTAGSGDAEGDVLDTSIDIGGRAWTIRLDAPDAADAWPGAASAVLAAGLPLAVVIAVAFGRESARRRAAEARAESRSVQLERIADAGARLQQSLDLAELLPAFAVALVTDFDLQSVSVSLVDDDGALVEAFATGEGGGASIDIPLRRGWRAVGVLGVRPGRPLDDAELTSLQALGDLLAVAMSNAQLYEREQLNTARLRDLDALKNAFLGTVSHELRTSMTAIMGFGEMLSDSWDSLDDDRRREMAVRIRRSAGSLRHLVDDLLDFARLEQERLRVSPRTIDLAGTVRQTVEALSPLLGKHRLVLDLEPSLQAWADPVAVERILANLVSNAAKYSPAGSTVTVTAHGAGERARLVVADHGPGIPPAERRRIFARFYRLDTPESIRTRGAGIGLAILADFAERSGATVAVDDAPGGGARFAVEFPTRPAGDAELAEAT